jgi:hypothetical protein
MGLEEDVLALCRQTFNQAPLSVEPLSTGRAAYQMLEVSLPGRTLVVRVGLPPERLLGSLAFRPIFRELGIPTAELLFAAEETEFVADTVQIFDRLEGTDLLYAMERLGDAALAAIAADVNAMRLALSTVKSPGGFGPVYAIERGPFASWAEVVLDEARLANLECLVSNLLPSKSLAKLYKTLRAERSAFDEVPSTLYCAEILARELLVCRGRVRGVLDPTCLWLGDSLDYFGWCQAAWLGHPRGMDYVAALLEQAGLDASARRRVDLYCTLARVEWLAERAATHRMRWDPAGPVIETPVAIERDVAEQLIAAL